MKKSFLFFVIIIIVSIISYNQQACGKYILKSPEVSTVSSGGYLFTELAGDLLTVDIRDATLNEVLVKLSAQNGIDFFLPTSLGEEKIMVRFSEYKIDRGLNKILSSYNRIFIYAEKNSALDQPSPTSLKEVRIYPRHQEKKGNKGEMTSIESPKNSVRRRGDKGEGAKKAGKEKSDKRKSVINKSKSLKNKNEMTVERVKALAKRGDAKAIGALTLALNDKNPEVQKEAKKALGDIGELNKEKYEADPDEEELTSPPVQGEKILTLATGSANGVNLELNNDVDVRGVQFTLNGARATEVRTTSRTEGFLARVNEKNGTVILVSLSGSKIKPGTGPIAEIVCDNKGSASLSDVKVE